MSAGAGVLGSDAIPGDMGALDSIVGQLRSTASNVQTIQSRVSRNGLNGTWSGNAANAFRASLGKLPAELDKLYSSFGTAADAIEGFARAVDDFQAQANWLASQIQQAEANQRDAESRHANAQTELSKAELAHAGAGDPLSQAKAQSEIDHARSLAASARSEADEHGSEISKLRQRARVNHDEYEAAASNCCAGLDLASQLGIQNSLLGAIGHVVGEVGGVIAAPFEWVGGHVEHWAEDTVRDIANLAEHPSWDNLRKVLEDAKKPLEIAGAALVVVGLVASVFVTGGADVPFLIPLAAGAADAGGTVGLFTLGFDSAITAGDSSEAAFGSGDSQRDARQHLIGDAFSTAADVVSVHGAGQESKALDSLSNKSLDEASNYLDTGNPHYLAWFTRYQNQYVSKLTNVSGTIEGMGAQYLGKFDQVNLEQLVPGRDTPKPYFVHQIALPSFQAALGID